MNIILPRLFSLSIIFLKFIRIVSYNYRPFFFTVVSYYRNRFKGLDLIDRVPEELWTEVRSTLQKAVIKTIPKKKACKKTKWLSEEALQIHEKRRDAKGKGEKERYIHLNAEFQRTARRDKIKSLAQ